ncbi:MAG: TIM barrel protein [Cytophagales bacterium]|nr:TIM barrel protein [Cytophagales bacterium]
MTSRRNVIKTIGTVAATSMTGGAAMASQKMMNPKGELKNNIKHSVCRWCYSSIDFETLCQGVKDIGMASIELTGPGEWPILKKYGLTAAIGWGDWPKGTGLTNFFADPKNHDVLVAFYEDLLPKAAANGIKNIICFSGNRNGMDNYTGMINCAQVIRRLIPTCEKYDVVLSMELLSSRDSHRDYMCDHIDWGVSLCEMVNSEYFKLLYDIFHMQSMHGDHIRNIRRYGKYISHYHTGGMPGRKEIDETQEIYYPAVIKALIDSGYKGYLGQEFIPTPKDTKGMLASLERCVKICDV